MVTGNNKMEKKRKRTLMVINLLNRDCDDDNINFPFFNKTEGDTLLY